MLESKQLYIALSAVIIWFATGILEKSLKSKDTVCSIPSITQTFG